MHVIILDSSNSLSSTNSSTLEVFHVIENRNSPTGIKCPRVLWASQNAPRTLPGFPTMTLGWPVSSARFKRLSILPAPDLSVISFRPWPFWIERNCSVSVNSPTASTHFLAKNTKNIKKSLIPVRTFAVYPIKIRLTLYKLTVKYTCDFAKRT